MRAVLLCLFLCGSAITIAVVNGAGNDDAALQEKCKDDLQKVMKCLDFAKGTATTPSKECCSSVTEMREKEPECLCFIIKQAQGSGGDMLKSLGVDKAKLLQLPSACQIKNANISDCTRILGLAPGSPDAAIFTNVSTTASPSTSSTPTGSSPSQNTRNDASKHGSSLVVPVVVTAAAIFSYAFPTGFASVFYKWA